MQPGLPHTRAAIAGFAGVFVLLAFIGCAPRQTATKTGTEDQILHVSNGVEPSDPDPQTITGRPEGDIVRALFEGLVNYDPKTLEPIPGVAESWEVSGDGLTYTFRLRAHAKWSNGDPVVAHDFVESWRRMLTATLGAEYAYMLYPVAGAQEFHAGRLTDFAQTGFSAPDPRTVVIRLKGPTAHFLSLVQHYSWFPVHLATVQKFGGLGRKGSAWTRAENIVSNGPFVLKEWSPNKVIKVERSTTYWQRSAVRLYQIHLYPVESQDTEERMFRAGQLHIINSLPLSKLDVYREKNPGQLHIDPQFGTMFMRVNTTKGPLRDPRVRRALALAIDRERITTKVNRSGKIPAYSFTPPIEGGFAAEPRFAGTHDEARALLAEAGYPKGEGMEPIELLTTLSENGRIIAEAIQEMWRKELGVEVRIVNQEWKVYLDTMSTLNFDVALNIWVGDYLDPTTFLDLLVKGGANNRTGWGSDEYDQLLARAQSERDHEARNSIFAQMEAILAVETPVLPVYFYTSVHLIHDSVRGRHPTLLNIHPWQSIWLE